MPDLPGIFERLCLRTPRLPRRGRRTPDSGSRSGLTRASSTPAHLRAATIYRRLRMKSLFTILCLAFAVSLPAAWADTVTLRDGTQIDGTMVSATRDSIVIRDQSRSEEHTSE